MSTNDGTLKEEPINTEDRSIAAAKWLLLSPDCPPLPRSVLDSFNSMPEPCPEEALTRMKKRVVEKLLAKLHPKPVRVVQVKASFGFYLKAVRKTVNLPAEGVAVFLGQDISYVKEIESGKTLPWQLATTELANIVILFRIHYEAVRQLMLGSIAVSRGRAAIKDAIKNAPRSAQKQLRAQLSDKFEAFTDEFYARLADDSLMTEEAQDCLNRLSKELKRRKATSFISTGRKSD